jgi:hypothetical protein
MAGRGFFRKAEDAQTPAAASAGSLIQFKRGANFGPETSPRVVSEPLVR